MDLAKSKPTDPPLGNASLMGYSTSSRVPPLAEESSAIDVEELNTRISALESQLECNIKASSTTLEANRQLLYENISLNVPQR
ncbi:hypothetical protein TSAR_014691, partial [Trichomalopsis sarcophagae]